MDYFCYVYTRDSMVPHMEAVNGRTLRDAKAQSRRLLKERGCATRAELFNGNRRVATFTCAEPAERLADQ